MTVIICPWCGSPALAAQHSQRLTELAEQAWPPLTRRELEIAALAVVGLSSREIACRLFVSRRTVDNHLGRIYAKLRVPGRRFLVETVRALPA
jgi:DNA-binding CsgD family transcriptional regulator